MSYKRAEEILPSEVVELIQLYVDGENIYILRKSQNRMEWAQERRPRRNCVSVIRRFIRSTYPVKK